MHKKTNNPIGAVLVLFVISFLIIALNKVSSYILPDPPRCSKILPYAKYF